MKQNYKCFDDNSHDYSVSVFFPRMTHGAAQIETSMNPDLHVYKCVVVSCMLINLIKDGLHATGITRPNHAWQEDVERTLPQCLAYLHDIWTMFLLYEFIKH